MDHQINNCLLTKKIGLTLLKPSHLTLCLAAIMGGGHTFAETVQEEKTGFKTAVTLPVITVYAEQAENTAASVTSINRDSMDQTGVQDMADIVKYLPLVQAPFSVYGGGTYIDSAGTSSYNIRGLDANRIGLDIDGVDLAEAAISPYMPPASMNKRGAGRDYIEPEMLNAVDIVSGTTDASTDGVGGRVSFKNKSPHDYLKHGETLAGAAKAGYSSADDSWLASVTGAVGNEQVKALVAYAHRDGHETNGNSKTKAFKTDWQQDAALANFSWEMNDEHQLNLTADIYQKEADTLGMDVSAFIAFKTDTATQHQKIQRSTFSIEDIYKPTQLSLFDKLSTKLWHQKSENETRTIYDTGTYIRDFLNSYEQTSTGIKLDAKKDLDAQKLKYGLIYDHKAYSSDRVESRSNGQKIPFTGTYLTDSTLDRYAVYVSDQFSFYPNNKELSFTPSLRVEHQQYKPEDSGSKIESKDFTYLAPGFTAAYQLTPENYSYFKYARGARIPSPMEMGGSYETSNGATYLVKGNSDLEKETSDAFEIGLKNTAIDGVKFDLTGFYTVYSDFIDYKQVSVPNYFLVYQAQNIADAKIWGGELSARLDLGQFIQNSEGFSLALVAGKTRGTAKNKDGLKTGLNSVQPEKGSLTFAYDDPNQTFGLGLTATAVGSKQAQLDASAFQPNGEQLKYEKVAGYAVWDLSAYWNINKETKLNVALNNIFDKTYWNYASVGTLNATEKAEMIDRSAEPGRNVTASIQYKF
ncbi:TonB-dependent receptor [Acinetobacter sp. ANC 5054]|uniref:TonB-dependent hemoglobin/transferrin/lactoferrin family receptor n=1 Tax=Acinetobacter sp. ANC 5054 TaxID=1977877 RepID=UPI000A35982B|nr:TonB-dependent hemoglobin/transferrin/lactoferrin family receptor [Acinetobacter sp. ANC 5054]OTG79645.1 TonB-dependent receptor [Acinetobacter sp. ANC 5054]